MTLTLLHGGRAPVIQYSLTGDSLFTFEPNALKYRQREREPKWPDAYWTPHPLNESVGNPSDHHGSGETLTGIVGLFWIEGTRLTLHVGLAIVLERFFAALVPQLTAGCRRGSSEGSPDAHHCPNNATHFWRRPWKFRRVLIWCCATTGE